jgi:hypothetical protein
VTVAVLFSVKVQLFFLLPPLEQAPDQRPRLEQRVLEDNPRLSL